VGVVFGLGRKQSDRRYRSQRFFLWVAPGDTWRLLEQRCEPLRFVLPGQLQPVARELQPRLPPCQNPVKLKKESAAAQRAARPRKKQAMQIQVVTFNFVSIMSEQTGFHFATPALRRCGDEHAQLRPASSAGDRRAGTFSAGGKYYG